MLFGRELRGLADEPYRAVLVDGAGLDVDRGKVVATLGILLRVDDIGVFFAACSLAGALTLLAALHRRFAVGPCTRWIVVRGFVDSEV